MVIYTSNKKFNYIETGCPRSVHDSRVFTSTDLHKAFVTDLRKVLSHSKFHITGDSASAVNENLKAPFQNTGNLTATRKQKMHNRKCIWMP